MRIHLINESNDSNINIEDLKQFIEKTFGFSEILLCSKILNGLDKQELIDEIAKQLASIKVKVVSNPFIEYTPFYGEIEFEKRQIKNNESVKGILYDGLKLLLLYWDLIRQKQTESDSLYIIITDRLFGTYSGSDGRYHIRSILCSKVSLISIAGIVEGPAKPRLFYKLKHESSVIGTNLPIEVFKEQFRGQFIDYNDPRITEVLKGFVSQALFFHLTGDPFCNEKPCRLYNAHWQADLIESQLIHKKFCVSHQEYLDALKRENQN